MQMQIFTVYDLKSETYHNPMVARTKGEAIRMFGDTTQDPNSLLHKHPEDFVLFHLGSFDNVSCQFDLFAAPNPIGKAIEFVTGELREVQNA